MTLLVATTWYIFMLASAGVPPTISGPLSSKIDCDFVKRQLKDELKPKAVACVEIPTFNSENPR